MTFPTPAPWVIELAPGGDPLDSSTWVWEDITGYVRVASGIDIEYGRRDEGSTVDPTKCSLIVNNAGGRFSKHNPLGPWYGQLDRNTPLRVRWGGRSDVTAVTVSGTESQIHPAPSVDAPTDDSLLMCLWADQDGWGFYSPPPGMTGGTQTQAGGNNNAYAAWQTITATGPTGSRTPGLIDGFDAHWLGVSLLLTGADGAPPAVEEEVTATPFTAGVRTLTTAPTTQRGWWVYAIQTTFWDPGDLFPKFVTSPGPDDTWTLVADSRVASTESSRMKIWARPVLADGAQSVEFTTPGSAHVGFSHARVLVVSGLGHERFTGLVSEWPPRWDLSGNDAYVPITANGVLRRLSQGAEPLRSPLYRQIVAGYPDSFGPTPLQIVPAQYWPVEDGSESDSAQSAVNQSRLSVMGEVSFGQSGGPVGSAAQALLAPGSQLHGAVGQMAGTRFTFEAWVNLAETASHFTATLPLPWTTTTAITRVVLSVKRTLVEVIGLKTEPPAETIISHAVANLSAVHHVAFVAEPSGGDTKYDLFIDGVWVASATHVGHPSRVPLQVHLASDAGAGGGTVGVSHVAVWPFSSDAVSPVADRMWAGQGFTGEPAADRVERICLEEGVPVAVLSTSAESMPMGPQLIAPFLDILRDCETTDGGVLHERGGALAYRPRTARYNQPVKLALDIDAGHLAAPPEPTDDDQLLRNTITVTRRNGSSATATTGDKERYSDDVTVNPSTDAVLDNIASWRLALGTNAELRWPLVPIDLARNDDLIGAWLAFRLGNRVTIDHAIPELPGVVVDLLVEGWSERLTPFDWDVDLNCVPATPWDVFTLDHATLGRLDTAGSELAAAVDADDVVLSVATTDGALWTTDVAAFPFDIAVGGEVMTVTGITGTTSPQTFTVTRGINGITKAHAIGAPLRLAHPNRLAL